MARCHPIPDNGQVTDLPRRAVTRTAKLAALPLGFAGRTALGVGKRVGGKPAEAVAAEVQLRTAEHLFRVLGELKGGAMKFGQAMSVFEAAMPEELAAPYRASLTKLQDAAPPLPAERVHARAGRADRPRWRARFHEFDDTPAAAASIGQVHRACGGTAAPVAVKIQYPGAGPALRSDLAQLGRMMRMFGPLSPGLDMEPLVDELQRTDERGARLPPEAASQRAFAKAFADDRGLHGARCGVRLRRGAGHRVGRGHARSGRSSSQATQDRARPGRPAPRPAALQRSSTRPTAARRPAPRQLPAARTTAGWRSSTSGRSTGSRRAPAADRRVWPGAPSTATPTVVLDGLRREGFVRDSVTHRRRRAAGLPRAAARTSPPRRVPVHRAWLRAEALRLADLRKATTGMKLNLPPSYLLIHRVTLGVMGVLCQLGSTAPFRAECERLLPGFAEGV